MEISIIFHPWSYQHPYTKQIRTYWFSSLCYVTKNQTLIERRYTNTCDLINCSWRSLYGKTRTASWKLFTVNAVRPIELLVWFSLIRQHILYLCDLIASFVSVLMISIACLRMVETMMIHVYPPLNQTLFSSAIISPRQKHPELRLEVWLISSWRGGGEKGEILHTSLAKFGRVELWRQTELMYTLVEIWCYVILRQFWQNPADMIPVCL